MRIRNRETSVYVLNCENLLCLSQMCIFIALVDLPVIQMYNLKKVKYSNVFEMASSMISHEFKSRHNTCAASLELIWAYDTHFFCDESSQFRQIARRSLVDSVFQGSPKTKNQLEVSQGIEEA